MADVKTVNLTIDGRPVSVPDGTSLLEAAKTAGILIPHYCYHPGLPVAGVCRMCLVEVEKMPKLAPACATSVADGQVVHVHSEAAREARKGVLEFLLINHPLDCPICDQSGECELQDYTFAEGRKDSRYREPKRFNPMEDFGGDTLYVPNRCILCTRCVRFMDTAAREPVLNVSERGDRAVIGVFEGEGLTHPWSSNVVDLCPVGALLSKDFLNKARAWELDRSASVCTGCSQGCNIVIETREDTVVRLRPRPNDEVNQYFMCDYGRMNYRWLNRPDRAQVPLVRQAGVATPVDWDVALRAAASLLDERPAYVLASPGLSNETMFLLQRLIARTGGAGVFRCPTGEEAPLPGVEDLSLRADRAPNVAGAELFGFTRVSLDAPLTDLPEGAVLVIADDTLELVAPDSLRRAAGVILLTTVADASVERADVVLPMLNVAEDEGTFTNMRGHVQRFLQAKSGAGLARPGWFVLSDLLAGMGDTTDFFLPSEVFAALAAEHPEFAGMSYDGLGLRGRKVASAATVAAGATS